MQTAVKIVASIALVSFVSLVAWSGRAAAKSALAIYFIDVEGGQSTLIVTPRGESLLIDTGFAANGFDDTSNRGRDAQRIVAAVRAAGLKRIDYLLTTHFH